MTNEAGLEFENIEKENHFSIVEEDDKFKVIEQLFPESRGYIAHGLFYTEERAQTFIDELIKKESEK